MTPNPTTTTPYITVPVYDNDVKIWTSRDFQTREDYTAFVKSVFKEPGLYEFDETSFLFNEQARYFEQHGVYPGNLSPFRSKDFIKYWDDQKDKCRKGVIYQHGGKTWYLTRDYYMWLNFLPIYDKEEKKFGFAKVRDAQYHMALYELLAELHYKHSCILKKRQIASSYFHIAKLLNQYWFEQGAVMKLGASLKDYINEKGSWKFLDEYRNFLNEHTAWYRPNEPDKVLSWQQRIKVRIGGRDTYKGLKSVFTGMSFEKDATNGVGGPVTYFFHEEAGIAPKMDETYGYMRPAMKSGMITTGMFIAAGSVGDLDQCGPLKKYILNPDANDFYSVETDLLDDKGTLGRSGLFIPEQWSMPPYIDEFGNSLVKEALDALDAYFAQCKRDLDPAAYQLELSQHPRNIAEAFASRKEALFPIHLVSQQLRRIEEKQYPCEYLELFETEGGKIDARASRKIPIMEFPISKKTEDKEGVICVWERPMQNAPWGTYYASVDPVGEGKTTTSESLCSIIVYKNAIEVTKDEGNGKVSTYVEGDKIVATWCGRFDDLKKTHERLEYIIRWYNAWTLVENNVSLFIQYMISKRMQRFLVPKDQILFLKELGSNMNVYADYGWKNTGTMFKNHLLSYGIQFMEEELDHEFDENGKILSTVRGVERIPDPMILTEAGAYHHGLNVDRLVSYCSLVAFVHIQRASRGMQKRVEVTQDKLENSSKMSKLNMSPFRHIGGSTSTNNSSFFKRNPFKNLR
jgi:hypothetical protein